MVVVCQFLDQVEHGEMAVEKSLAAQGAGHVGIGVVVVHDACDEELHKIVHAAIFAGKVLRRSSGDPDEDRGQVECGLVGDGELVRSQGQAAPLLESVDAPLDGVALPVSLGGEGRWSASVAASPQPMADLVGRLGDDSADSTSAEVIADRAG